MKILNINIPSQNEIELEIEGESHTLGSLISKELLMMEEVDISYYIQEHPLKNTIKLYLKTKQGYSPYEVLEKAVDRLLKSLDEIKKELEKELQK